MKSYPAGRIGEKASIGLSKTLARFGFKLGRLRTGTPPRLLASSIDFTGLIPQSPDKFPVPFSYLHKYIPLIVNFLSFTIYYLFIQFVNFSFKYIVI